MTAKEKVKANIRTIKDFDRDLDNITQIISRKLEKILHTKLLYIPVIRGIVGGNVGEDNFLYINFEKLKGFSFVVFVKQGSKEKAKEIRIGRNGESYTKVDLEIAINETIDFVKTVI